MLALLLDTYGVLNEWLAAQLAKLNEGLFHVEGDIEPMFMCLCCRYHAVRDDEGWSICPVCFWEDVGQIDLNEHGGPNHMSLREAKVNFLRLGASSEHNLENVLPEGKLMYSRE